MYRQYQQLDQMKQFDCNNGKKFAQARMLSFAMFLAVSILCSVSRVAALEGEYLPIWNELCGIGWPAPIKVVQCLR